MVLYVVRVAVLTVAIIFSIIVLGLAAELTSESNTYFEVTFDFAALAITSAAISIATLPVLMIVDMVRTGAFTSMVVVELVWLFVVWVLWLSTGALAAQFNSVEFDSNCALVRLVFLTACHEEQAIVAFSFLIWMMLMVYSIIVLVMAIIGSSRGHHVWTNSVKNANFLAPSQGAAAIIGQPGYQPNAPVAQAPMQQHQYPPPNTPQGYGTPHSPSVPQGYPSPPPPPQSPYYGTQASHASGVPSQDPSQGPIAYV